MLTLTRRLPPNSTVAIWSTLTLTADERSRSRHCFETDDHQEVYLQLPRGTVLYHQDLLVAETDERCVQVVARPEPVMTVTASVPHALLRAAYHLGNRHVPLEVAATYLRLAPDPVLKDLLMQLGLQVYEEIKPFQPESGAYGHHSSHDHAH
ncbi:urease accessory protein UreE [Oculatella sp. LEGE 06141]|uniref:urease accessory protein UreE n=1 Tax=Oculatella sp. LEGE 06141 TaxID=1828648 RepID=UPI00187EC72F|nr:urease accessory protein UreE [Oculatella sp. LEGE 06141]MBE9181959.1 urease accessory protein UreE [Oculatella sp. LEGE 06141]